MNIWTHRHSWRRFPGCLTPVSSLPSRAHRSPACVTPEVCFPTPGGLFSPCSFILLPVCFPCPDFMLSRARCQLCRFLLLAISSFGAACAQWLAEVGWCSGANPWTVCLCPPLGPPYLQPLQTAEPLHEVLHVGFNSCYYLTVS